MNAIKRGKSGKYARPNTARNALGRIGQAMDPVFDIVKGPAPSPLGIKQITRPAQPAFLIATLENQKGVLVTGRIQQRLGPQQGPETVLSPPHGFPLLVTA